MTPHDPDERELDAVRDGDPRPDDPEEIARNRRLGAAARALTGDDLALVEPPPALWDAIAARAAATDARHGGAPPAGGGAGGRGGPEQPAPAAPLDRGGAPTRRHGGTRGTGRAWLVGAAAAAVLVVAALAVTITRDGGGDGGDTLATAELAPLPDAAPDTEATEATVVAREGADTLDLQVDAPPPDDGFYEVWLIDERIDGMVSLGPARDDGRYAIPPGVDFRRFPIVDVSIEPPDGEPAHSGRSVLRGTLS